MNVDVLLFRLVNAHGDTLVDPVMVALSSPRLAVPLVLAAFGIEARERGGWRAALRTALVVAAAVVLSDSACHLVKVLVARVRPCAALDGVRALGPCPSSLSMPSAHAANAPAAATVWGGRLSRPGRWTGYVVAALVCLSRVYLGVHYPSDVAVGATIGVVIGAALRAWDRRDRARVVAAEPTPDAR